MKFVITITVLALLLGCTQPIPQNDDAINAQYNTTPAQDVFTLVDVAKHNTPEDCWMVIHGAVFDLSGYQHSGGNQIFTLCGKDATDAFYNQHQEMMLGQMVNMVVGAIGTGMMQ